jgi:hypothetical protein
MVSTLADALNGQRGKGIAAIEAMHKVMTDYIRESDEPLRQ